MLEGRIVFLWAILKYIVSDYLMACISKRFYHYFVPFYHVCDFSFFMVLYNCKLSHFSSGKANPYAVHKNTMN